MGCDIHPAIEYRESESAPWKALLNKNPYFGKYGDNEEFTARLDVDRDYDLFAMLGNVRNGTGFAGCDTGDRFAHMSHSRGIPDDISDEAKSVLSHEHSATWVTLSEILAFDWTRTTKHRGSVDPGTFAKWDRSKEWNPEPESWSGGVSGAGVKYISNDEMREAIKANPELEKDGGLFSTSGLYTVVEWEQSYSEDGKQMWTKILPPMLKLGALYGHDNVRLVMDFDS